MPFFKENRHSIPVCWLRFWRISPAALRIQYSVFYAPQTIRTKGGQSIHTVPPAQRALQKNHHLETLVLKKTRFNQRNHAAERNAERNQNQLLQPQTAMSPGVSAPNHTFSRSQDLLHLQVVVFVFHAAISPFFVLYASPGSNSLPEDPAGPQWPQSAVALLQGAFSSPFGFVEACRLPVKRAQGSPFGSSSKRRAFPVAGWVKASRQENRAGPWSERLP